MTDGDKSFSAGRFYKVFTCFVYFRHILRYLFFRMWLVSKIMLRSQKLLIFLSQGGDHAYDLCIW